MYKSLILLVLLVSIGCGPRVTGFIDIENPDGEIRKFIPEECRSGQHEGFNGVDIWSDKDGSVRIRAILDPVNGAIVIIKSPRTMEPNMKFTPPDCEKLDLSVIFTGTHSDNIPGKHGTLSMKCKKVTAEMNFGGCH